MRLGRWLSLSLPISVSSFGTKTETEHHQKVTVKKWGAAVPSFPAKIITRLARRDAIVPTCQRLCPASHYGLKV